MLIPPTIIIVRTRIFGEFYCHIMQLAASGSESFVWPIYFVYTSCSCFFIERFSLYGQLVKMARRWAEDRRKAREWCRWNCGAMKFYCYGIGESEQKKETRVAWKFDKGVYSIFSCEFPFIIKLYNFFFSYQNAYIPDFTIKYLGNL